jgi:hypothetical protein
MTTTPITQVTKEAIATVGIQITTEITTIMGTRITIEEATIEETTIEETTIEETTIAVTRITIEEATIAVTQIPNGIAPILIQVSEWMYNEKYFFLLTISCSQFQWNSSINKKLGCRECQVDKCERITSS